MKWILPNNREVNIKIQKYLCNFDSTKGSSGEKAVRAFLKKHSSVHIWCEQLRIPSTRMTVDFLAPGLKIAIEYDGAFHHDYNKWAHKGSRGNFHRQIIRDTEKDEHLERNNFKIIRLEDEDLPLTKQFFIDTFEIFF